MKHVLLCSSFLVLLFAGGCTAASASVPVHSRLQTAVATPQPIRPPTATPISIGGRPIYVVDPRGGGLLSRVLVIDPDAQRVVEQIQTRYAPEIAISPEGRRLFVADSYSTQVVRGEHHDVVSVYRVDRQIAAR